MYQVLIVHGGIASGKTRRGEQIADRARVKGYNVRGILSQRVMRGRKTIGYDMIDLESRKTRPIVYAGTEVKLDEDEKVLVLKESDILAVVEL